MQHIEVDNQIVLFLDHSKLINNLCNVCVVANARKYVIKREIFDFKPKPVAIQPETVSPTASKKRKRKRSATVTTVELTKELQELHDISIRVREKLHKEGKFDKYADTQSLPRYWEENCDFPKFHGANTTNTYQTFAYKERSYIIPPQCYFFNCDVLTLAQLQPRLPAAQYDLIVLDPPWRNKYIRRLKHARQELAYTMLDNAQLQQLPIAQLAHRQTLVAVWCTNSVQHQTALIKELFPNWNLRLLHAIKWLKLNTAGHLIGALNEAGHKQPYEMLYLAVHKDESSTFATSLQRVKCLLSVPSVIHSHKPPLLPWLQEVLPKDPKCLEIFARYLQPRFTSLGLEVLKLMDKRLFDEVES